MRLRVRVMESAFATGRPRTAGWIRLHDREVYPGPVQQLTGLARSYRWFHTHRRGTGRVTRLVDTGHGGSMTTSNVTGKVAVVARRLGCQITHDAGDEILDW